MLKIRFHPLKRVVIIINNIVETKNKRLFFLLWFPRDSVAAYKESNKPKVPFGELKPSFRKFYGNHHELVYLIE